MDEKSKKLVDTAIEIVRPTFIEHSDPIEAQKRLIIAMSEILSDPITSDEVKEYMFQEAKKILKELFAKEEKQ